MGVRSTLLIGLVSICLIAAEYSANAQTFVPVHINTSTFPAMTARIYALDATGLPQAIGSNDVTAAENGVDVVTTAVCEPSSSGRNLSLLVAMDISASTSLGSPSNLDLMKNGARSVSPLLTSTSDEIGVLAIDGKANLMYGLSTDKSSYSGVIDAIRSTGGLRLSKGFLDQPMGALTHLQNARNSRVLLLFSDGASSFDLKTALGTVRTFGIRVYVVCTRASATADLKALADSSGGAWIENISSVAEAQAFARAFVADAKQLPSCTLSWNSPQLCATLRTIVFTRATVVRPLLYEVPSGKITVLEASSTGINFGEPTVGNSSEKSIQLIARNGDVTINTLTSTDATFTIVAPQLPVTISNGQVSTLTLRYTPTTTDGTYGVLTIGSSECNIPTISMKGGSPFRGDVLELVSPNGGEDFLAGQDTSIKWTHVLPEEVVRLEVSLDGGGSWRPLTETANGLSYAWRPGPEISGMAKIRISRTVIDDDKITVLLGQNQPVYSIAFTTDGQHVITGGHDGTVRLWNTLTGVQERLVGVHNDWVWDVAVMPGTTLVASASYDQSVRIWDYTTGVRVATIPVEGRSRAVAFTPDGKKLFAGSDRSVIEISTSTWSITETKIVDKGPVYDIDISSDGRSMAVAEGPYAVVRNVATLDISATCASARTGLIYAVGINADASRVVSGGADFVVATFDAATGAEIATTVLATGSILGLTYAPDGQTILSAGADATAKIYDATSLKILSSLAGHTGIIYSSTFSPDAKRVGTASTDFTGRIWVIDAIGTNEDVSNQNFRINGATAVANAIDMGDAELGSGTDRIAPGVNAVGTSPLTIISARITGGDVSDFSLLSSTLPSSITSGSPLPLDVSFTPTVLGPRSADLDVVTGTGTVRVRLSGNGVNPPLTGVSLIDFGRRIANQSVVDTTISLRMPSNATQPLVVNVTRLNGPQRTQFSIVSGGGAYTLNPGEARSITIRFEPIDFGRFASELVLETQSGTPVRVRLYGEGTGDGRIATSENSMLFPTNLCSSVTVPQTIDVSNSGNTQLQIFSAAIEGANAQEFTIASTATYPITVDAGATASFTTSFNPTKNGAKDAKLVFSSSAINAINGRTVVQISARKDSVGFELSRPVVSFGNINEGDEAIERVLLLNTGTVALRWPRLSISVGPFRIENISPEITQPGQYSDLTVRFLGGTAERTYDESYTFIDSVCQTQEVLRMVSSVQSVIGGTLRIATVRSPIGQEVSVPITLTKTTNMNLTQVSQIEARLRVNGRILTPTAGTPMGSYGLDGMRVFTVTVPIKQTDSVATTLHFLTSWGNDTSSVIYVDSLIYADTLVFKTINGEVVLSDICRQGGARLLNLKPQGAGVRIAPQPASGSTTAVISIVEAGRTKLELIDINGSLVVTVVDRVMQGGSWFVPLDLTSIPNGSYMLVLSTPTQRIVERIAVAR